MKKENVMGFHPETIESKNEAVQQVMSGNVRSAGSTIGAGAFGSMAEAAEEKAKAFNDKEHLK